MATSKKYLDITGLTRYDTLIKNYIDDEDAKSYKKILLSVDETKVLFFKDENATVSDTPDFELTIGTELTNIILNGQSVAIEDLDFYAPTTSGVSGQVLVSGGSSTAPSWMNYVDVSVEDYSLVIKI